MHDEQILNEIVNNNNKEAYRELILKYQNKIFSTAYKFTNDHGEAQDLTQDIFLKIYKNINRFNKNSKLSTWIYKISINTCLDWKKKHNKATLLTLDDIPNVNNGSTNSIDDYIINNEKKQLIHNAVKQLPDIYKTVVILYHFNNRSYNEISKILSIPTKTVETRLYRARKKIKEFLHKQEVH